MSLALNEETMEKHESDREKWKQSDTNLKERLKKLSQKYDEAKKEALENQKVSFFFMQ